MLQFPRYVFNGSKTQIVVSKEDYDSALDMGWFGTVDEAKAAPVETLPVEVPVEAPVEPPPVDLDAPPTRAELEAKANEMCLKFHPNIGDKKLAALISSHLGG